MFYDTLSAPVIVGLSLLAIWEVAWKGIALWRAARNQHTVWFVILLILNTAGILPIIYLLTAGRQRKTATLSDSRSKL